MSLVARAIDWPANYDVAEKSTSPDGRYAILAPSPKAVPASGPTVFYLADLKTHKILSDLPRSDNRIGRVCTGVHAEWQPDSNRCIVQLDDRYGGYAAVTVLTRKDDAFEQYDIGDKMRTAARSNLRRWKAFYEANYVSRALPDGKILFHAWVCAHMGPPDEVGSFIGTFDPATGNWQKIATKTDTFYSSDKIYRAHLSLGLDYAALGEKEKAVAIDSAILEVGIALRAFLPTEEAAAFEKEQAAWFEKRKAVPDGPERTKFTEERVKVLKARLWE